MHWFRTKKTRIALGALALTAVLTVTFIAAGTVVGGYSNASRSQDTTMAPAEGVGQIAADVQLDDGGKWEAGDMHTHTFLTGGSYSQVEVAHKALNQFRLDWMANSEHGGVGESDQFGNPVAATPRWWSLMNWSWPIIRDLRPRFPGKTLVQGVEWNVPTHEHASVGFASDDPSVVAEFDYRFDAKSTSDSFPGTPPKDNTTAADALDGIAWLQANYMDRAYLVLNHPSRRLAYQPGDVRDFIAAGPDVTTGFEGMPGHQKQADRDNYGSPNPLARTYQGADPWLAQVGGFWDSILANGSRFHTFTNSDFHSTVDDFWPGEYSKNWTFVARPDDVQSLVVGIKSGRSFASLGDLVDGLRFSAQGDGKKVGMGRDALAVHRGEEVVVTIKFHTPPVNNNGDVPKVDHLDLIAGSVTGPAVKGTASWDASTNPSARVVSTFEGKSLQNLGDGWYAATYLMPSVQGPTYLRLRATNLSPNTPGKTDAAGNPLVDAAGANGHDRAWKSLWFYSNPIWIDVR